MPKIFVEVRPDSSGHLAASPRLESLTDRLDEISTALKVLAMGLGEKLKDLCQATDTGYSLDEIELKANIALESGAKVVIVNGKASAGFEASLKWKRI